MYMYILPRVYYPKYRIYQTCLVVWFYVILHFEVSCYCGRKDVSLSVYLDWIKVASILKKNFYEFFCGDTKKTYILCVVVCSYSTQFVDSCRIMVVQRVKLQLKLHDITNSIVFPNNA